MTENFLKSFPSTKFFLQAPAPWQLEGEGIILIYKFSKKWVENFGQLPSELAGKFKGGLGFLILVNYTSSPVGPYHELLLIPGRFSPHGKQSITKIYVDNEASTQNGRANWGIPKKTLPFSWIEENGISSIKIFSGERTVFSCKVIPRGIPFPTSTSLLPIDLHQELNKVNYFTKPSGSGWGRFAKVEIRDLDVAFLPDIRSQRPFVAVKIKPFRINFPVSDYTN
jgi:hypothetical protein